MSARSFDGTRRHFLHRSALLLGAGTALARARVQAAVRSVQEPAGAAGAPTTLRVRVWCEGTAARTHYPNDIDEAVEAALRETAGLTSVRARLEHPEAGLSDAELDATDVLIWWGRLRHDDVPEDRVRAVVERVKAGRLGLVALYASFGSKPFKALMGTSCEPRGWREDGRPEKVAVTTPGHPIVQGVSPFVIPKTCMFADPIDVPEPDAVVLTSTWDDGSTFRSGMAWTIGQGRVAYLRPGDDAFPVLYHPSVRRLVANAATWAGGRAPVAGG